MRKEEFFEILGDMEDDIVLKGMRLSQKKKAVGKKRRLQKIIIIAAAVMATICVSTFAAYEFGVFDRWLQVPKTDPIASVRAAVENQKNKEYAIKIKIKNIEIDEKETALMIKRITDSFIAGNRGWSDEYLAEHFVAVRADYYAEYDHTKTNRSDGHVVQYFYLTQDQGNGKWTIIDNAGNQNWWENEPAQKPDPMEIASPQEQLFVYMSDLFNTGFAQYYDGLHYGMDDYQETIADGQYEATFHWTMYHLGTGWDISGDQNVEQEAHCSLKATTHIDEEGRLDVTVMTVLMDVAAEGPPEYTEPIEEIFPVKPSK